MQYLVSVIDDKSNPGSTDRRPAISVFNERLIAEGYWIFAGGLADTDAATVIDNRGEQPVFTDGPFVESKESSPAPPVHDAALEATMYPMICSFHASGGVIAEGLA